MLNQNYKMALDMVLSTNGELAKRVIAFLTEMPNKIDEGIRFGRKKGACSKGDNYWEFVNEEKVLSISVGKKRNFNRDYMNLSLNKIIKYDIPKCIAETGEIHAGYVTFYLYDKNKKNCKPIQLSYDVYLTKVHKDYVLSLSTRTNSFFKDTKEVIEQNGFSNMVEEIFNNSSYIYKIEGLKDTPKIKITN